MGRPAPMERARLSAPKLSRTAPRCVPRERHSSFPAHRRFKHTKNTKLEKQKNKQKTNKKSKKNSPGGLERLPADLCSYLIPSLPHYTSVAAGESFGVFFFSSCFDFPFFFSFVGASHVGLAYAYIGRAGGERFHRIGNRCASTR